MAKRTVSEMKKRRKAKRPKVEQLKPLPKQELVTLDDVDNPFAYGSGNPQQKVKATQNRMCDPLIDYFSRKQIDKAQAQAGLKFQSLYMLSGSTAKAMDPSKEPVDGGGAGDPFTQSMVDAIQSLIHANQALGVTAYRLVEQVCGHGVRVNEMTFSRKETERTMRELRDSLDILAGHWGFLQETRKRA